MTTEQINPAGVDLREVLGPFGHHRAYLVYTLVPAAFGRADKVPVNPENGRVEAPNSAIERGILTVEEALHFASELGGEHEGYGIGVVPGKVPGLVAVDLDSCVAVNGDILIDEWALKIVGEQPESYVELSPSLSGLRVLIADDGTLEKYGSGVERCGIGIYGAQDCKKFVTLTGLVLPGAALKVAAADAMATRILDRMVEMMGRDRVERDGGWDFPHGKAGVEEARQAILDGTSLHPATARLVTSWFASGRTRQSIEEELIDLYDRSAAKVKTPRRWRIRRNGSIKGLIEWTVRQQGYKDPPSTQARQAAAAAVTRHQGGRLFGAPRTHSPAAASPAASQPLPEGALGFSEEEQQLAGHLQRRLDIPFEDALAYLRAGFEQGQTFAEMLDELDEEGLVDQMEVARGLVDELKAEAEQGADWEMYERLPAGVRDLADYALASMPTEYPELAVMATLATLSAVTQNGFVVRGKHNQHTPLSLYTVALAPSGRVKSYVEGVITNACSVCSVKKSTLPGSRAGFRELLVDAAMQTVGEGADAVAKWPSVAFITDEIGMLMQGLAGAHGRQAGHEDAVMATLFSITNYGSAWGSKPGAIESQRIAGKVRARIENPYVTLCGFSTAVAYYGGLTMQMVEQGFGNRFLPFHAEYKAKERPGDYRMPDGMPEGLYEALCGLRNWSTMVRPSVPDGKTYRLPSRLVVPPGSDKAWHRPQWLIDLPKELFGLFTRTEEELTAAFKAASLPEVMVARFYEQAVKVAGLIAVWSSLPAVLDFEMWNSPIVIQREDVEYACWLVSKLILRSAKEYVAKTVTHVFEAEVARAMDAIKRGLTNPGSINERGGIIEALKAGVVPKSYLIRVLRRPARLVDEVVGYLVEAGFLELAPAGAFQLKKDGRQGTFYVLSGRVQ